MKKLGFSIALSMVAMIFLGLMPVLPVGAQPHVYVQPALVNGATVGVGNQFTVGVWVTGYTNVFGWQFRMNFDPTLIDLVLPLAPNPIADPNYIFFGRAVVGVLPVPGVGTVLYGDTLLGGNGEAPPPEPAVLAYVTFVVLKAPAKYETLETAIDITNPDTYLLDDTLTSTPITTANGLYQWIWVQPTTLPNLAVVPASVELGGTSESVVGTQFDVDLVLQNLDVGWAVTALSFAVKFNTTVIDTEAANITVNIGAWDGPWVVTVTHGVPWDRIDISVSTTQSLSGDVVVATVTFTVMIQGHDVLDNTVYKSPLDIQDEFLEDHAGPVPMEPSDDGEVIIKPIVTFWPPFLSVDPADVTLGPELVIGQQFGKTFCVDVRMNNLSSFANLIGVEFRLAYDPDVLQVLSIVEGPYMAQFAPYGTWFYGAVEPEDLVYPQHVLVGILILPDGMGNWAMVAGDNPQTGPLGEGVLATITFKPLQQSWIAPIVTDLELIESVGVNTDAQEVPFDPAIDGIVTILPIDATGRVIDVWMFDPALGGEGPGAPADLVLPQMALTLTAKVTYNWQPIAYKKVTFEIRGPMPCGSQDPRQAPLWAVLQDDTCDDGHAYVYFRMPWTGHTAEDLIGVWWIGVSVTLADVVITDYMEFDYDYLIHIWSVTTDKDEYYKCNDVVVTVEFGTKSMREHTVTMYATLQDELGVPIGIASKTLTVGGASLCHYKNYTETVTSHVPLWAYAGLAIVRVSFVWGLPSEGGEACAQECTAYFWILPVHWDDPWLIDP